VNGGPDYTPQPGDVVRFSDCDGDSCRGILFADDKGLCVAYDCDEWDGIDFITIDETLGTVDFMDGVSNSMLAKRLAGNYFSNLKAKPAPISRPFKVGDRVKIARKVTTSKCCWVPVMDYYIGSKRVITLINGCYVSLTGVVVTFPIESLEHA
jgi:hypothetical protein